MAFTHSNIWNATANPLCGFSLRIGFSLPEIGLVITQEIRLLVRLSRRSRRSIRIACHMIAILPAIRYNSKQRENTQPVQRRQYLWTRNILIWPS